MIPDAELQQMRENAERMQALREKATPGPWEVCHDGWQIRGPEPETGLDKGPKVAHTCVGMTGNIEQQVDDAEFIAAARTDPSAANVLRLVGEVEQLTTQRDAAEADLERALAELNETKRAWGVEK